MNESQFITKLTTDFVFFVEQLWLDRGLDKKAPLGWAERDMLRFVAEGGSTRRGVLAPRGIGKTHLITISYPLWRAFRDPNIKVQIVSKSDSMAKQSLTLIRSWIRDVWFLRDLMPHPNRGQRDSTQHLDVGPAVPSKDPTFIVKGIDGQLEGGRAHLIIADDIETKGNTKTLTSREQLDARVREFTSIATYGDREIIYVGTYHHEESVYLKLAARGYEFRTWPILFPTAKEKVLNLTPTAADMLARGEAKPGDKMFPHRMDDDYIAERRGEGMTYWAMQQMLLCDLGDSLRYPLRLRDLIVFPCSREKAPISISWGTTNNSGQTTKIESTELPMYGFTGDGLHRPIMFDQQWSAYTGCKMWIDPSGKGKDRTGYAIIAHLNGYLWLLDADGIEGGYENVVLETLALKARHWNVREMYVEDVSMSGMLAPLLRPIIQRHFVQPGDEHYPNGWKCFIEPESGWTRGGYKEERIINALEPIMNQHRLVVHPDVAANERFQRQLTRITRHRGCLDHDDVIESVAACVWKWRDALGPDPAKQAERDREKRFEDARKAHVRLALGKIKKQVGWVRHFGREQ